MKTVQKYLLALMLGVLATTSMVQAADLQAGRDYRLIEPALSSETAGKIEVIEFFSYGCPHCAQFQPLLRQWAAKLPSNVVLRRVPVAWNAPFASYARLYLALEMMGEAERLDADIFNAIHQDGERLDIPRARDEWLTKKGVNLQKFNEAYNSFSMQTRLRQGDQLLRASGVDGVPALVVAGQYVVLSNTHELALKTADALIAKARVGKGKK